MDARAHVPASCSAVSVSDPVADEGDPGVETCSEQPMAVAAAMTMKISSRKELFTKGLFVQFTCRHMIR
jgi:hypothetical protein